MPKGLRSRARTPHPSYLARVSLSDALPSSLEALLWAPVYSLVFRDVVWLGRAALGRKFFWWLLGPIHPRPWSQHMEDLAQSQWEEGDSWV